MVDFANDDDMLSIVAKAPDRVLVLTAVSIVLRRLKPAHEWRISFVVYQPDTASEFKKSKPRKPYTHVCVCG